MAGEKVLVIDDDNQITTLVSFILRKEGFITVTANDGEQGINVARQEMPDLVILDLMMPKMDGYEVCRVLKGDDQTKAIPIIMLTAMSMGTDVKKGIESGTDWYITKPFESQFLVKRVKLLLNHHKKKEE